jgi:glyoxylase I family protein
MAGAVHHVAICTTDVERSLRFWRDGMGLTVLMDERFEGDWPTLLQAPGTTLRSVFLGDPAAADAGIVEVVDLGDVPAAIPGDDRPTGGFLLVSFMVDLEATLQRLNGLGLGGEPRRIVASGVAMAVVHDPDGTTVELIDTAATANLDRLTDRDASA